MLPEQCWQRNYCIRSPAACWVIEANTVERAFAGRLSDKAVDDKGWKGLLIRLRCFLKWAIFAIRVCPQLQTLIKNAGRCHKLADCLSSVKKDQHSVSEVFYELKRVLSHKEVNCICQINFEHALRLPYLLVLRFVIIFHFKPAHVVFANCLALLDSFEQIFFNEVESFLDVRGSLPVQSDCLDLRLLNSRTLCSKLKHI